MSTYITENTIEEFTIKLLQNKGYEYIYAPLPHDYIVWHCLKSPSAWANLWLPKMGFHNKMYSESL